MCVCVCVCVCAIQGIGDSSSGLVNGFLYILFTKKVRRTVLRNPCSSCSCGDKRKIYSSVGGGREAKREPLLGGRAKVVGGASLNAPSSCKWEQQQDKWSQVSSEIFTPVSLTGSYQ